MNNSETSDKNTVNTLPQAFLSQLINEFDDDTVTAIILHGSYARGEAIPPYSDVDFVRILRENTRSIPQKRLFWREEYLISVSSRPISVYRDWFTVPEHAIFVVPGIQEAHILLDKDGALKELQQEALAFQWAPLQKAADSYASQLLLEQTELVLKSLRAFSLDDMLALADMTIDISSVVAEAIAVQRGVFIASGNTYFRQVQEAVGKDSSWTYYHQIATGTISSNASTSTIRERGIAALHLYQETAHLLQPSISLERWKVIEKTLRVTERALMDKQIV